MIKFAINNIPNFIIQILCLVILLNELNLPKIICYAILLLLAIILFKFIFKINIKKIKEKYKKVVNFFKL